jgi:gliding motility-associated-like protein
LWALLLPFSLLGQECSIFYVTPNGTGSGTKAAPTSLTSALAAIAPGQDHIRLAAGNYTISAPLNIISNVTMEGGFDPNSWIKSNNTVTRIVRTNTNVEPNPARLVALSAVNVSNFNLHDMTIVVEDAAGSGVTTYGVYVNGCSNYSLNRIKSTAGSGSNGLNGTAGVDGANGAPGGDGQDGNNFCPNGSSCEGIPGGDNNAGGAGGNSWSGGMAAGGNGGNGGAKGSSGSIFGSQGQGNNGSVGQDGTGLNPGQGGDSGDRWRNTASGPCGIGCFISLLQDCGNGIPSFGSAGTNAVPPGENGENGVDGIATHDGNWFVPGDGEDGEDGEHGSGGGGGGGGGSYGERLANIFGQGSGAGGGGGGEGGQAGTGASGGLGGGGSFGFYITNNGTGGVLNDCVANSGFGGVGGTGGFPGGLGGQGGLGGWAGQLCSQGGQGGNGSKGGNGGFGGNGAAGVTQPIYEDPLGIPVVQTSLAANVEPNIFLQSTACTFSDIYNSTTSSGIIEWFYEGATVPQNNLGQEATVQYTSLGQFDVTMVSNGVPYFLSNFMSVTIDGLPYLPTIQASDDTICPGDAVNFSATWPTNFPVLGYRWDFGDPASGAANTSSAAAPSHTYNEVGQYMITLQTESNCCGWSKPDTFYVQVMPVVTPQVFITATTTEICEGESITFGAIPVAGGDAPTYQWFLNGVQGGTGNSFTPPPLSNGDQVRVRMASSYPCPSQPTVDSETITVIVHPNPVVNCSNVTNSYLGANTGFNAQVSVGTAPFEFFWQFGDGGVATEQSPTHLYGGTGTYPVSVEVIDTFGCSVICEVPVEIILPPYVDAGFSYTLDMQCGSTTVQFTDTSTGNPVMWEWQFGDGAMSDQANPSYTYDGFGPFTVTLVASNGVFWDTIVMPNLIDVRVIPQAGFVPSETEVCDSSSIRFYDNSDHAAFWEWDFGDPASGVQDNASTLQNPFHEFNTPGTYTVNLTVFSEDMCPSEADPVTITVHRSPIAGFYVDTVVVCTTLPIAFYDTSKFDVDITSWYYHFSDKDTLIDFMNQDEYLYVFDEPGWFLVTQYVTNDVTGCRDSALLVMEVRPHPVADYWSDDSQLFLPDTIMNFWNSSEFNIPDSSWWDFGNGYTLDNMPHGEGIFQDSGLFDVQLIVMNELGCADTIVKPFRVWEQETFFIQTGFTPNGDGYNDKLEIKQKGIVTWHMVIYDRWGKRVWETLDVNDFWDGTHIESGLPVQQGAYGYRIELTWYTGRFFSKMGTITVVR